ncbi:tetratricopeptide repeat protein [Marinicella gelatinilytica]|uniref:tetratricopeptide repeat protein n=1 Tax=Marinicella gelatinilytica TaxID=2996017 RepID=UPI002260C9B3|nr:tetratricopeptide repeat protein [Marinicella gelatinilytica]MCX7545215.1 tetratricopeptide repeat protein [Marinicella gelatinilytica]
MTILWLFMMVSVSAEPPGISGRSDVQAEQLIPRTLLDKVAEGDGEVAYFIGNMFKQGLQNDYQSIPQDDELAQEWFLKSAELGYVHGMFETGLMLYRDKQWSAAKKWLQQAAEAGHGEAFYRLAYFSVYGLAGEAVNCQRAYSYFEQAKIRTIKSAFNDWAWMLATQPNEDCRNGHQALKIISELESMYGQQRMPWAMIDTKAAVLAEIADFNGAIELQSWVVAGYCGITVSEIDDFSQLMADYTRRSEDDKIRGCDGYVERLNVYSQRQPWREEMVMHDDKQ